MRNSTAALVLLAAAGLGIAVGVVRVRREHLEQAAEARERAAEAHLGDVARCLTLLRWTLDPTPEGGGVVRTEVLPGRDGRVALDAHGGRGADDVLVPELQTERLLPTVVHAGVAVVLERRLRRVRTGQAEELALRFSCRPPGPKGTFGVIEYNSTVASEAPDGYGGLLRPLPPAAR
ncbi:MAG: hypothetical protein ACLQIH_15060 [Myxococcaceae bacterium]